MGNLTVSLQEIKLPSWEGTCTLFISWQKYLLCSRIGSEWLKFAILAQMRLSKKGGI